MASGTITGTTSNQYIDCKIEWYSNITNVANNPASNSSTLSASLYYRRNNAGFETYGSGTFSIVVNETDDTNIDSSAYVGTLSIKDSWVKAHTIVTQIKHDDDGTKSVKIKVPLGAIPGTTLVWTSCSGIVTLDTIQRASTITSAGNVTLGDKCSVKWTPLSKSFAYKIKFDCGNWSYTTGAIQPKTTSAYTYTGYTIPLSVANQLPNSKTGTINVTLYTYSDSGCTKQVGSSSSKNFTVTVPSNTSTKPSVSMTLSPKIDSGTRFIDIYIQGKSKVIADFSGEGKYGATVSSYEMYVGNTKYNSPYLSGYLSTTGSITVKGRAYDSRGYYNDTTETITVIPYSKPKILPASGESAIICARCDSEGKLSSSGTYLKIKAKRSYSKVEANDIQNNFCAIRYRYKEDTATTFSSWVTILAKNTTSTDTVDTKLSDIVSSTKKAYVVQVGVTDDIGETATVQFNIPTDFVTINVPENHKGKRIGIFRYAEDTDEAGIDVGAPIHGGGVDNLTLGEIIAATSAVPIDLNNYKTPGNYYSPSADNSKYITNSPYKDGGFSLTVREIQSANMIRQELFYGRTNWQRHYNSSTNSWSDWLRYLMTEYPETTATDFVTDIGVWNVDDSDPDLGYWRYRKWKSGAVDLNGLVKVNPVTEGTLGNAGVYYSEVIYLDLPFEVVNFNFTGSTNSYHCFVGNCNSVDGNSKQIRLRLYRFTDFAGLADYNVYVRIVASGKLK